METRKVLSALCYFSMVFAGFVFPLVVFFVTDDPPTKSHAKKAFVSHLIPIILLPLLVLSILYDIGRDETVFPIYTISSAAFMVIVGMTVFIWNIVKGVKVLTQK